MIFQRFTSVNNVTVATSDRLLLKQIAKKIARQDFPQYRKIRFETRRRIEISRVNDWVSIYRGATVTKEKKLKERNLAEEAEASNVSCNRVITRQNGATDGRIDVRLQVRQRIDGGGVVQREQHVREHDRPAFGSLLAWTGLPRRSTDQHARIGRWNARLPIRRFVKSPLFRTIYPTIPCFFPHLGFSNPSTNCCSM